MSPPALCRAGRLDPLDRRAISRFVALHGSGLQFTLAQDGSHLALFEFRGSTLCLRWDGRNLHIATETGLEVAQAPTVATALEALLRTA